MSETWTEYAVRAYGGDFVIELPPAEARNIKAARTFLDYPDDVLVGRNVTASDWLPVDTEGAK